MRKVVIVWTVFCFIFGVFSAPIANVTQSAKYTNDRLTPKNPLQFQTQPVRSIDTVTLDRTQRFQTILGFGGAFTEAAGSTLLQLPVPAQKQVIDAYFGPDGLHYTVGRVHINSCDFSIASYNFDNVTNDLSFANWDDSHNDLYLVPMIQMAQNTSKDPIRIFGTPWSPPGWMKGNGQMDGSSTPGLLNSSSIQDAWARYLVKAIDGFAQRDIKLWGLTVQNEAEFAAPWEACVYDPAQEAAFVRDHLGPRLRASYPDLQLMIYDHNKDHIVNWVKGVFSDPEAAQYVAGTAFHWYSGSQFENVVEAHELYPDKFVLATEACNCPGVLLDDWTRGENYGYDIIGDLQSWSIGWTDWNILLNQQGGPNHVHNYCDAPIIADVPSGTIHFQPPYFYMGQISKFILPGSVRIGIKSSTENLSVTAAVTPEGNTVIVVMNKTGHKIDYKIVDGPFQAATTIPEHAIQTFVYTSP